MKIVLTIMTVLLNLSVASATVCSCLTQDTFGWNEIGKVDFGQTITSAQVLKQCHQIYGKTYGHYDDKVLAGKCKGSICSCGTIDTFGWNQLGTVDFGQTISPAQVLKGCQSVYGETYGRYDDKVFAGRCQ